jgi:heat shock protein HslJ
MSETRTLAATLALVLGTVLAIGCAGTAEEGPPMEGQWKLAAFGTDALAEGVEVTMEVRPDGTAGGSGGCNRYTGKITTAADGSLSIGPIAATRRMCPPPQMDAETRYFQSLEKVTAWRVSGGQLELQGGDGQVLLRYVRAS